MPAHMTLKKPARGTATKARRARKRAADAILARNVALVRERDGHRCRVCGSSIGLQVHHIAFRSQGGSHATKNLVLVCDLCHGELHARTIGIEPGDANGKLRGHRYRFGSRFPFVI